MRRSFETLADMVLTRWYMISNANPNLKFDLEGIAEVQILWDLYNLFVL
jgi:hypothetical protein